MIGNRADKLSRELKKLVQSVTEQSPSNKESKMTSKSTERMGNKRIAFILALLTLVLLVATEAQIGLTWDEPAYMAASESYGQWFGELISHPKQALEQETIDSYWGINHEHPPADKIWSDVVWRFSHLVFNDLTAHRMGNMLLVAALVAMLYLIVAEEFNRTTGFLAVASLLTLPRFFFHAHLAALDMPAAVMIFAVLFVFWRTKDRTGLWSTIGLGVVWGLAVATKINAIFIMPTLLLWMLIFKRELRLFIRLVLASILAFPIFVFSWPWLYPALYERMDEYIRFITVDHWEIGQFYLHEFHMPPPWHFPFVMLFAVVPLTLMLFCLVGVVRTAIEKKNRGLGTLFIFNALVPMIVLSIGESMVYDNERLFMPTFVYIAALAGIGLDWALVGIRNGLKRLNHESLLRPATAILLLLVFVPHLALALPLYPHWLSYYSESVGSLPGARRMGLETTYWCETFAESLAFINTNAEAGDSVWTDPWSHDVMVYYQLQGRLRDDVDIATPPYATSILTPEARLIVRDYYEADFVVLQYRQTAIGEDPAKSPILAWAASREPDIRISYRGVPLLDVYQR
jgi:4-amino-4-deoxy-L-arabinose transferase-like glycosyltransferase